MYRSHKVGGCLQGLAGACHGFVQYLTAEIRFEAYSCCFKCAMPCWICDRYEQGEDRGWRPGSGKECQYRKSVVYSAAAGFIMAEPEKYANWIERNWEGFRGSSWQVGEGDIKGE